VRYILATWCIISSFTKACRSACCLGNFSRCFNAAFFLRRQQQFKHHYKGED